MTVSVRLPAATLALLSQTQRRLRTTKSAVIEAAIREYCSRIPAGEGAWDRVKHLVGTVRSGEGTLSADAGRKMREGLSARRGVGRSRR